MRVDFLGVRGSVCAPGPDFVRYGGNTSCLAVSTDGDSAPTLLLDAGTGIRAVTPMLAGAPFRGTILVSHVHWDHVQGLPFFPPADRVGAELDIYGPSQLEGPLGEVFGEFMKPPYFPVHFSELRGEIRFHDVLDEDFAIGGAKVRVRPVPHCGPTVGYRIEWEGATVVYISDHQAPLSLDAVAEPVLELCEHADLLIHDAQYTEAEFAEKAHWGHCTVDYAALVARQAGARKLALFHHDPGHDDRKIDELLQHARAALAKSSVDQVVAAYEGLQIEV